MAAGKSAVTEPEPMAKPVQLTEAERAALAILVTREIQRLQRINREAGYTDHGYGNTMRPIMSELELKLRAARKPDIGPGEVR